MAENTTPMNAQSELWFVTINDKKEATTEQMEANFSKWLNAVSNYSLYQFVAGIKHDKDYEDGKPKTPHIHIFIQDKRNQTKKALMNELISLLGINEEQIGIIKTENKFLLVQYLKHQNDPQKAQYEAKNIITNDREELEKRLGQEYLSAEDKKIKALNECNTTTALIKELGISEANKLRGLFKDIKAEQRSKMLTYWDRLEEAFNDLMEVLMDNAITFDHITDLSERARVLRIVQNAIDLYRKMNDNQ